MSAIHLRFSLIVYIPLLPLLVKAKLTKVVFQCAISLLLGC